jgi:hypothetical protein
VYFYKTLQSNEKRIINLKKTIMKKRNLFLVDFRLGD